MANGPDDLIKTADLGNDWFVNLWRDGSLTVRNSEKGQRINVPAESVERLRAIFATGRDPARAALAAGEG